MEGGGRSAAAAAAAKKKRRKKNGSGCSTGASRPPRAVVPFDQVRGGISDALRERLAALGATAPSYVVEKEPLEMSDVHRNQARLLFSCKGEAALQRCPLTACFTEQETRFVWEEDDRSRRPRKKIAGLLVTALDRGGRSYNLVCRYLTCNFSYRFKTEWKKFVENNGLSKGMRVELWAFRSRQLPNRYERVGSDDRVPVAVRKEIGHPDGSLGLVVLHYDDDERDPEHGDDEHDEAMPVQETETETGTTGQMKSEAAAAPEEKLLTSGGAACAEPTMTREEMVARFGLQMFLAAVGLIMLKRRHSETQTSKKRDHEEDEQHKLQCSRKNVKEATDEVTKSSENL
ncbi:hypothetical protein PAHAL_5G281100 [Panicum hallii]|jgi:hypothetical protein|uniref:TF-B3 domain-containing protein n=1 Tax=Panicum hallii TaxID=206008 RepID=A0A2T8ILI2_9POAL|nr:hypothetical protein PAHAL_5G281100 [Panicum hallii]